MLRLKIFDELQPAAVVHDRSIPEPPTIPDNDIPLEPYFVHDRLVLYCADILHGLNHLRSQGKQIDISINSPPYFCLIDYECAGQYGLENSIEEYLGKLVGAYRIIRDLMPEGGTHWIVIGDTINNYSPVRSKSQRRKDAGNWKFRRSLQSGYREKEPLCIPFLLAQAMREDGWHCRGIYPWDKGQASGVPNSDGAPQCHEFVLQFTKWSKRNSRPYANCGPLKSSVLRHNPAKHPTHPCPYPPNLVREILSVCQGKAVLDCFAGSGTTLKVALEMGFEAIGIELSPDYCEVIRSELTTNV